MAARRVACRAMSALESLRERLAELVDLSSLGRLAAWDQRTMMPPGRRRGAGAAVRRRWSASRTSARRATSSGRGWTTLEGDGDLSDLDRDVVRIARRDWDRAAPRARSSWPPARAQAAAEGQDVWQDARARSRLRAVRAGAGAQRRARARVRGVLRRRRPSLRRAAGRLRLRADGRARAGDLRPARRGAAAARGRGRRAARRAATSRVPVEAQQAAVARRAARGSAWTTQQLARRRLPAPVQPRR